MQILSLSSAVAYGHVGNRAAVLPLQRLGFEVWPVDTVQFSNHPGHGGFAGTVARAEDVAALVDGLARLGVLDRCDGLLTGYLGDAGTGAAALAAHAGMRADALYLCDPVMGDEGPGVSVRPGIPDFMRERALPAADVV
ncbi:MAG: pyridoxal kinase, partial [Actinomycetota bacterium]